MDVFRCYTKAKKLIDFYVSYDIWIFLQEFAKNMTEKKNQKE